MNTTLDHSHPHAHHVCAGYIQHGFGDPEKRRTDRRKAVFLRPLHGRVRSMASKFWAAVRDAFGHAGSFSRFANPHGSPSPFGDGVGEFSTHEKESCHV